MRKRIRIIGQLALFWIAFFITCRALFLIYHSPQTSTLTAKEIATLFLLGLRMDLAMTGYWLLFPSLILSIPYWRKGQGALINSITLLFLSASVMIVVVDLELYKYWGFRINETPLHFIGLAAVGSVQPGRLVLLLAILTALAGFFAFFYWRKIWIQFADLQPLSLAQAALMLLLSASLIIPIRSSLTVAPINTGVVYFHKTKPFANHAGINATWNFFNSVLAQGHVRYPSDFYEGTDARQVLADLVMSKSPAKPLLRVKRTNIILIVLESFTSNIIEPLGGTAGVTPNFNRLIHEGILFDKLFASGDRTPKALVSLLSGYPAQPNSSIINYPEKTQGLPYLPRALEGIGYHTSFLYGGDIGFANIHSYLTTGGFSHITSEDDFNESLNSSKWGVPDHYVFERLLSECDTAAAPFFNMMLTLSSHEPFEVPMPPVFRNKDENSMYLNACYYTDKSLGEFIEQAKRRPWWKDTMVILIADHGHPYPQDVEWHDWGRFRIPMLWLGGALVRQDSVVHTMASQPDLVNTLLGQVDKVHPEFLFSKDILDLNARPFAAYIFQDGFGYLDPNGEIVYEFDSNSYRRNTGNSETIKHGRAYMQVLFDDYNRRH